MARRVLRTSRLDLIMKGVRIFSTPLWYANDTFSRRLARAYLYVSKTSYRANFYFSCLFHLLQCILQKQVSLSPCIFSLQVRYDEENLHSRIAELAKMDFDDLYAYRSLFAVPYFLHLRPRERKMCKFYLRSIFRNFPSASITI